MKKHLIDCDADPFVPDGFKVEEHKKGGKFEWDVTKVALYLDDSQKNGSINGNKLRKKLEGQPVLNANVLDYLLAHLDLIPEEWKDKATFFWGTVYRDAGGGLCVRCLSWHVGRWFWDGRWLGIGWHDRNPAAVLTSAFYSDTLSLASIDARLRAVEEYITKLKAL